MGSRDIVAREGIVGSSDAFVLGGIEAHFSFSYSITQNKLGNKY